jgi:coenzyme F420-reducing hydrogenase gamma subunit
VDGPYDLSLVEGSVSTPEQLDHLRRIRETSRTLVTIGACATAGGIQALRNGADVEELAAIVYARPDYVSTLAGATPVADHVAVDFELRGCPIDRGQLLELVSAYLAGRPPRITATSVCTECKARRVPCVLATSGTPCLGPVTQAGCGAICPAFGRGCYGCFGPCASPNTTALDAQLVELGVSRSTRERLWRGFTGWAPEFRAAADRAAGSRR